MICGNAFFNLTILGLDLCRHEKGVDHYLLGVCLGRLQFMVQKLG